MSTFLDWFFWSVHADRRINHCYNKKRRLFQHWVTIKFNVWSKYMCGCACVYGANEIKEENAMETKDFSAERNTNYHPDIHSGCTVLNCWILQILLLTCDKEIQANINSLYFLEYSTNSVSIFRLFVCLGRVSHTKMSSKSEVPTIETVWADMEWS